MIPTLAGSIASQRVFNDATGGSETTVSNYNSSGETWKVHTFTGSGSLTVTRAVLPFRVLCVGGGGSGAAGGPFCSQGGPGGNAAAIDTTVSLSSGSNTVTVGGVGGTSSLSSVSAVGGGNGGPVGLVNGVWVNGSPGTSYSRIDSNITGTTVNYAGASGSNGPCGSDGNQVGGNGAAPGGGGGGGGGIGNESPFLAGQGGAGASGTVIVAYRIG
jgi:hypothetical protein